MQKVSEALTRRQILGSLPTSQDELSFDLLAPLLKGDSWFVSVIQWSKGPNNTGSALVVTLSGIVISIDGPNPELESFFSFLHPFRRFPPFCQPGTMPVVVLQSRMALFRPKTPGPGVTSLPRFFTKPVWLLLLLLAVLAALQTHFIVRDRLPLRWDESFHALHALEVVDSCAGTRSLSGSLLDLSSYYPPLTYLLSLPGVGVFGRSVDGLMAVQVWLLLLGVIGIYGLGREVGGGWVGLWAAWMMATAPIVFGTARTYLLDVPLLVFVVWASWALVRFAEWPWPRRALLLGVFAGLAMLVKWTAFLFLLGTFLALVAERGRGKALPHPWVLLLDAGRGFAAIWKRHRHFLLGMIGALLVAFVVAVPWYGHHWSFVVATFAGDPVARGIFARPGTSETLDLTQRMGFYVAKLGGNQLHLMPALLVLIGASLYPRRASTQRIALVYGWLLALVAFTWIPLKDPRFTVPALPLLFVAGADGFLQMRNRKLLISLVVLSLSLGFLQWGMTSYRWFSDRNIMLQTPIGELTVWGPGWHGTAIGIEEEWPLEPLVRGVEPAAEGTPDTPVLVLSRHEFVHQSSLQLQARFLQYPARFTYILHTGLSLEDSVASSEWLIVKTGDVGPPFSAPGVPEMVARVLQADDPLGQLFDKVVTVSFPDGSEGIVLHRRSVISP